MEKLPWRGYGEVAIRATKSIRSGKYSEPREAWNNAAAAMKMNVEKSCPLSTFLGLCEEGLVDGVPRGCYTKSTDNKEYGIRAVRLLEENAELANCTAGLLWKHVMDDMSIGSKAPNSQMDIVLALWRHGLIQRGSESS